MISPLTLKKVAHPVCVGPIAAGFAPSAVELEGVELCEGTFDLLAVKLGELEGGGVEVVGGVEVRFWDGLVGIGEMFEDAGFAIAGLLRGFEAVATKREKLLALVRAIESNENYVACQEKSVDLGPER